MLIEFYADPSVVIGVHASAMSRHGQASIFLGPSGTGKTTICRLLNDCARQFAEDMVYLIPRVDGKWGVASADHLGRRAPLSKPEITALETIPLHAIYRLYQAPHFHLKQIPAWETCRHLTVSFFEINWFFHGCDKDQKVFSDLAMIARSVSGYELNFDLSLRTATMICSILS